MGGERTPRMSYHAVMVHQRKQVTGCRGGEMRGTGWRISGIALVMVLGHIGAWAEDPVRPLPPEPEPAAVTEAAAAVEPVDDLQYAYGSVAEVAGDRLVVSEFDEVAGTMATQTYTISPDVELYDVDAVGEIAVGDEGGI